MDAGTPPPGGQPNVPAGWYANPTGPGQRYWDGTKWTESYQQPQMPQKKSGGTVWKVMLGIVLGGLVLIIGCAALISSGVDEAEKEQNEKGITLSEFRSIPQGTSQAEVERKLGEPEDAQEFENEIPELNTGPNRSSCIYYPEKNVELFEGKSFQFCFDDGKLTSKNAY